MLPNVKIVKNVKMYSIGLFQLLITAIEIRT